MQNNHNFFYQTIAQTAIAEFKDRGSKFIAYSFPINNKEDFKKQLNELKKEHAKAAHFCFAYRLGLHGNDFRVSDDGEPAGSAGKPILNQIDSKQLTNLAVIVVRYFGGTLLGVPGLINAYKSATTLALQVIPIIQKPIEVIYELQFDYTLMNEIMQLVKQLNCSVSKQEIQLFCLMQLGVPKQRIDEMLYRLKNLHSVSVKKIEL
ncbi:MAG: YigZ family protein [Bacteroidetes bacterium]|nr:YigZ family protein [Bacteroidota bacterium]MBS1648591.1 YigZ family protein [Bacteroidota bacterium]